MSYRRGVWTVWAEGYGHGDYGDPGVRIGCIQGLM